MSDSLPLGPSILAATRFLTTVHRDIHSLVLSLDEIMLRHDWRPAVDKTLEFSHKNPDLWLVRDFFRIYVPKEASVNSDVALAVVLSIDPPAPHQEPMCLCIAARMAGPTPIEKFWDNWSNPGTRRLMSALGRGSSAATAVPNASPKAIWITAVSGDAFLVPLCQLHSEPVLEERVVSPLLSLLPGLITHD